MIRKAIIVMLSLLALWTPVEFFLDDLSLDWESRHPLLFEAGSWECGYMVEGESAILGCQRLLVLRTSVPTPRMFGIGGFLGVTSGIFSLGPFTAVYSQEHRVHVYIWLAVPVFAAYPTIALIRGPLRRRRRRKRGLCLDCAYNLTGNTSGVCPECAAKVEG